MTAYPKIAACISAAVLLASPALASDPVAETTKSVPALSAKGAEGDRSLAKGDGVYFKDRISTSRKGAGEFRFKDGTKLAVGPAANIVIDESVTEGTSTFQKLGLSAVAGSFRWISGRSDSAAYQIKTPTGTMGVRGTAFDITIENGRTHVVLLSGSAEYCSGSNCQPLTKPCDYVVSQGDSVSKTQQLAFAFGQANKAAPLFPFQAEPARVSAAFRVRGGSCVGGGTGTGGGDSGKGPGSTGNQGGGD